MRRFLRAAALAIASVLAAGAAAAEQWPIVARVRFEGALLFDDRALAEDWSGVAGRAADPAAFARAADRTLARYAAAGRLAAVCRLALEPSGESPPGETILRVTIDEGAATPLGDVAIEGMARFPEPDARRILGLSAGKPFDAAGFARGAGELVERYEADGYPFVRVSPRDFADGEELSFRLLVEEGPRAPVLGLEVTGNEGTRPSFIAREMLIRPGRPWSRTALERGRARLLRTGLFRSVGEPFPLLDEEKGGLRVGLAVVPAPSNRIEGVLGWNPGDPSGESGFLSGYLDLQFKNIAGSGRKALVRWEQRARDTREIRLAYREPWVPYLPMAASVGIRRLLRDSTYAETGFDAEIEVPVGAVLTITARGGSDSWRPGDRDPAVVPASTRVRWGAGFRYEGSDFPPNPKRGANLAVGVDIGSKTFDAPASGGDESDVSETISHGLAELFVPFGGRHVLMLRGRGDVIRSDEEPVPEYELFYLGGARSLRGYDEDRFIGERTAVATFEYRLLLSGRSRVFLFADQGFVHLERPLEDGGIESSDESPLGWGGGLQSESGVGVIGIGVGIPEGEGIGGARVHVTLEQEF